MDSSAFLLAEDLNKKVVKYILHAPLWQEFNYPSINLDFEEWTSIRYLNSSGNGFSSEINSIPNNVGGLYLFYIKCKTIRGMTEFPFYIGRAQHTEGQNLRKRVKEYFQHFSRDDERPKIYRMFAYWGKDLHLAYLPLGENSEIIDLEKDIINSLLLPMNDKIPDKTIASAIKAF